MEAFSLLKYWRWGGGCNNSCAAVHSAGCCTTTIVTTHQVEDTDDDGPFFDLEFAVPDEDESEEKEDIEEESGNVEDEGSEDQNEGVDAKSDDGCSDGGREFNFTLSSGSSTNPSDPNLTSSPSDDLFFKGRLVEEIPITSLLSRDSSKSQKQQSSRETVSDEKKLSKDVYIQKYLKKVKPLYVRGSRRYGEKLKFSGQLNLSSLKPETPSSTAAQKPVSVNVTTAEAEVGKNPKQVNIHAGFRVVCKHLEKSRPASSAVATVPPAPAVSKRRDSLLQQQDGIQGAILHCRRSFNGCQGIGTGEIMDVVVANAFSCCCEIASEIPFVS
ncbi:hypothetical protein F3Y22_tig00110226pilonHSYRG00007 [Hibiscus syriacus]|uniref:Membrane-associated kinase regulator 2 n=1 Tax=Hibiscus syriacus TaxID=106335 RepID=A0A6A3B949_HIBSY|nr:hypothetical protein F3Y22_tig00110226pilonHSYRG00007 [Hibiscus syriacus]